MSSETLEIHREYELPFPVETVYAAWISSETVIAPATAMDIDAVVGGHYRLIMETDEFSSKNEGRFLIVEPNQHLCYTWEWNDDGQISEIDVTFSQSAKGSIVTLVHAGLADEESVTNHANGWDSYIEGFKTHLSNR